MDLDDLAATAVSAVDAALWDLKARLLGLPLALLLGRARDAAAVLLRIAMISFAPSLPDGSGVMPATG